ncbi:Deoxyuridine 5'-triphosphate nucleotidohydrolase [Liparis tanakae]|uniref:dUTP diphosphatase n=1 Tax=Liparis tanakae TaxID=230148 RepID=A0A4Z2ES63_9TELE|nr:Deoxyuridine 5'-triphosphate nucleotidohydrolase [Liparis tanakae]
MACLEATDAPVLRFARLSAHATPPTRGSSRAAGYDLYRWVVPVSRCPVVPVSRCPVAPVSRGPGVPVSRGPGVPVSRGPVVPVSRGPGVPVSRGPGVPVSPVSRGPGVPVSRGPVVPGSRGPGVPWSRSTGHRAPRSGLAVKHFIDVGVKRGDRVAQLVCERICYPELVEQQALEETPRGAAGFGSTGSS